MSINPKALRRLATFEGLENRVVPSSASVQASAASTQQAEHTELSGFNNATNPVYASFAGSVFGAESALVGSAGGSGIPSASVQAFKGTVAAQVAALGQSITASFAALPGASPNITQLVQSQFTGSTSGSLLSQMNSLLDVASSGSGDGSIPSASLGLLGVAVNNAVAAAYDTTSLDAYYFVTGGFNGSGGQGGRSAFDLYSVAAVQDAAWGAFTSTVVGQETTLANPIGSASGAPITTGSTVSTATTQAANTLSSAVVSSFGGTPASGNTGALQGFLSGSGASSLPSQVASLLNAATAGSTTGSVPSASLPLLYAAVDHAIDSSFEATSVSSFLLAISPRYFGVSTGATSGHTGRTGTTRTVGTVGTGNRGGVTTGFTPGILINGPTNTATGGLIAGSSGTGGLSGVGYVSGLTGGIGNSGTGVGTGITGSGFTYSSNNGSLNSVNLGSVGIGYAGTGYTTGNGAATTGSSGGATTGAGGASTTTGSVSGIGSGSSGTVF